MSEPTLKELQERHPQVWERVARELAAVTQRGPQALASYVESTVVGEQSRRDRRLKGAHETRANAEVRHQRAVLAARSLSLSAATGVQDGHVRFNKVNGTLAQKLLFSQGLERKPVSMRTFKLVWPRLTQRSYLMPLVA